MAAAQQHHHYTTSKQGQIKLMGLMQGVSHVAVGEGDS
ncbi:hypothetical protein SNOG_01640 [Parastagonospora nodorum SN15]|uniref:Uncharacterized protein n=1 Tax=Phaeosphaeria nodorum (strain SN15 / ATCC MYA-4574 / FGSC 10173) TaxID=321614 RepID=Q0V2X4_PHANO|nr:hypothetical protein SNOG_01640 [Parastagonospora nodorum SN15]EAT91289.1 hypothetical protein SNOG_01640 [Parastagonospora nodorum SN15]